MPALVQHLFGLAELAVHSAAPLLLHLRPCSVAQETRCLPLHLARLVPAKLCLPDAVPALASR